jgi:hypothetical protein
MSGNSIKLKAHTAALANSLLATSIGCRPELNTTKIELQAVQTNEAV